MSVFDLCITPYVYLMSYVMRVLDWAYIWWTESKRPLVPGVRVERIKIPSRDPGRFIHAIKYSPEGAQGMLPVHLSWQASGWVLLRLGLDRYMHSTFAKRMNAVVIDADYRRGPWHKYPAAQDDCEDAVGYVLANPARYDLGRFTLGGSSAGGNMALSTAARFGPEVINGVFALYPVTELDLVPQTARDKVAPNRKYHSGVVLVPWMFQVFYRAYTSYQLAELKEPRFSPLRDDVSRLPEHVLVACGDADSLYPDGRAMVEKIQREGSMGQKKNTEFFTIPDESHEFNNFPESQHSFEWRDKLYDAAMAKLQAAWNRSL